MPIVLAAPHPEAKLSAFYKDSNNKLYRLDAWIGIDPEGVTEEDVQRLEHETYTHLYNEDDSFEGHVLIMIQGGLSSVPGGKR